MKGTIVITNKENVKIHSYISPEDSTLVSTQIIETKHELVVVDAQFLRPYAREVKAYIAGLNKPINRIIISHSHPDHWFGLEFFQDVPVYSLPETKEEIEKLGDVIIQSKKPVLGDLVTDKKYVPTKIIAAPGKEAIDGVIFEFERIKSAEAVIQLLIKLPQAQVLVAQDLAFNRVHLFIGQKEFKSWMQIAQSMEALKDYSIILAGHGEPADSKIFHENIQYLNDVMEIFLKVKTGAELKHALVKKYPAYRGAVLLDISNSFLYPQP